MSQLFFSLQNELESVLRAGDLTRCEHAVAGALAALAPSPFHVALGLAISNSPAAVALHFDRFFRREGARFAIGAAYTEMNGFDINPDRWYCDVFAYERYGGPAYYDWIPRWQSEAYEDLTITGLEPLQEAYASELAADSAYADAYYVAGLLVVIKFQDLIRRAAPLMRGLRFPMLATAHDFEFIYEVRAAGGRTPGRAS